MVNTNVKGKRVNIGKIELMKNFSFFEIEDNAAQKVIDSLKGLIYNNRKISVEIASNNELKPKKNDEFREKKFRKRKDYRK